MLTGPARWARAVAADAARAPAAVARVLAVVPPGRRERDTLIVNELVSGVPLGDVVEAIGLGMREHDTFMPVEAALYVAREVARVACANETPRGIVHVAPQLEIVVDWDARVRVQPWRFHDAQPPAHRRVAWLTPERIRGLAPGPHTDVFVIGLLVYRMLEDDPPFQGASDLHVLEAVRFAAPRPLARRDVPRPLLDLVERALHKQPDERVPVGELADALDRLLADLGGDPAAMLRGFLAEAFGDQRAAELDFLEQLQAASLGGRAP
jgi:hypothetical protein